MYYLPPTVVDGVTYLFESNEHKNSKRLRRYFENEIGLRFVVKSHAYNDDGLLIPDYVSVYIHQDDKETERHMEWRQDKIFSLRPNEV